MKKPAVSRAADYEIHIWPIPLNGDANYIATVPAMPRISAVGKTREIVLSEIQLALAATLKRRPRDGTTPPAPRKKRP